MPADADIPEKWHGNYAVSLFNRNGDIVMSVGKLDSEAERIARESVSHFPVLATINGVSSEAVQRLSEFIAISDVKNVTRSNLLSILNVEDN